MRSLEIIDDERLAWNARNADTRPALARLIGELGEAAAVTV